MFSIFFPIGEVQKKNASIALQLARAFLAKKTKTTTNNTTTTTSNSSGNSISSSCEPFKISVNEALGLRLCAWPGRSQTVTLAQDVVFFLDGAHTKESAEVVKNIKRGEKVRIVS